MKVLLSSIGSRGDIQPVIALALELRAQGHDALLCVPPNFAEWAGTFGLRCVTIGPDLRKLAGGRAPSTPPPKPTKAQGRQMAAGSIREQFRVLTDAARDRDLIVACAPLQWAAHSVAESLKIAYAFATWCPVTLPSPEHAPPKYHGPRPAWLPGVVNRALWRGDARRWNHLFGDTVNEERAKIGLAPVPSIQAHMFGDSPLLAASAVLAPAARNARMTIEQTGAWLLPNDTPLPEDLERFLAAGDAPLFLGFGSMRAAQDADRVLIDAARSLGRRVVISQGWANLGAVDAGADVFAVGDVNYRLLLPRVAAIVHHGGAGTTHAAALAGTPQVIVPHVYDQYYFARRVETLGIGVRGPGRAALSVGTLTAALRACLREDVRERASAVANQVNTDGTRVAVQCLARLVQR